MPSLKALPKRVILRFSKPAETYKGGIIIPETSQKRPEFGEVYHIGDALDDEDKAIAKRLEEIQREGKKIAVTYAAGTGFWDSWAANAGLDEKEWGWLKDYRAYRISELAAFVEDGE